ncbi:MULTISPECIES: YbdD/YjiX family protein [unclassified Methylophilus]|uniref:YbdD/YjiX family protein n=1 Tax=unclassified Methylophilus TaxID=2630143 RepID=UPI00037B9B53|nr:MULTISPECIES: YbdD/YjiX family protein [unclassified Methylophilus]
MRTYWLKQVWQRVRQLSGDDAYERYLAHYAGTHAGQPEAHAPLSRAEFFKQWQDQKWTGIKRCC